MLYMLHVDLQPQQVECVETTKVWQLENCYFSPWLQRPSLSWPGHCIMFCVLLDSCSSFYLGLPTACLTSNPFTRLCIADKVKLDGYCSSAWPLCVDLISAQHNTVLR